MPPAKQREIWPDNVYTLAAFKEATGAGEALLRSWRNRGLKTRKSQGRTFVIGRDFLEFISGQPQPKQAEPGE